MAKLFSRGGRMLVFYRVCNINGQLTLFTWWSDGEVRYQLVTSQLMQVSKDDGFEISIEKAGEITGLYYPVAGVELRKNESR